MRVLMLFACLWATGCGYLFGELSAEQAAALDKRCPGVVSWGDPKVLATARCVSEIQGNFGVLGSVGRFFPTSQRSCPNCGEKGVGGRDAKIDHLPTLNAAGDPSCIHTAIRSYICPNPTCLTEWDTARNYGHHGSCPRIKR